MVVSVTSRESPYKLTILYMVWKLITAVKCAKYLEVSIDSELRFSQHVDNICKTEGKLSVGLHKTEL